MMHLYSGGKQVNGETSRVLILVVMDDALVRETFEEIWRKASKRLNPCCNG